MEPHLQLFNDEGDMIFDLKHRLTRLAGRKYVHDVPMKQNQVIVEGVEPGQKVWVAAMGNYLVAEVAGNVITWWFAITQEESRNISSFRGLQLMGWILYGIY